MKTNAADILWKWRRSRNQSRGGDALMPDKIPFGTSPEKVRKMLSERFNPTKKSDIVSVAEMWSKTTERDIREELKKPSQNRRRREGSFYPDADGRHAAEQSRPGGGGTWLHHRRGDERRNRRRFRRDDPVILIFPRSPGKRDTSGTAENQMVCTVFADFARPLLL